MATTRTLDQITTLIIHCAATPNGRPHTIDDIDFWHGPDRIARGKRPFKRQPEAIKKHRSNLEHIGYHFAIAIDGSILIGRHLTEVGAHCRGHNDKSVGICLFGSDKFSAEQWYNLRLLSKGLQYELPNLTNIYGHNDLASYKTCPGFSVQEWLLRNMQPLPNHLLVKQEINNG